MTKDQELCGKLAPPVTETMLEEKLGSDLELSSTLNKKRARRLGGHSPLVESEVRRSVRVQEKCKVFKQNQCKKANCLGCTLNPPTLSLELMKNIGSTMRQIDPSKLEEDISVKKKTKPIGKKKEQKNQKDDKEGNNEE